ncbi:uncharacterized protein LOC119834304 [Zerene cesonia]|uniref:uncharacterized protein LOC119834304 n=1 Tax=Zerene cesonia TaxID=33412 RepID=UPI0018E4F327|nr:uncharacterized protein LOC119834304 [Zerene cesonia]
MMGEINVYTIILLLFAKQAFGIRVTELTVPSHAVEDGSVLLQCHYDLEGDMLYSIKWYKDNREFFRYVPSNNIPFSYFPLNGVTVYVSIIHAYASARIGPARDQEKDSSSNVVKLVNLTPESAGLYRCEVSGEGPYFVTVFDEKKIRVHLLPYDRPRVIGLQEEYKVSDILAVNCTSSRSRPQTQLKWLINNEAAPRRHITGPWYRISDERPDARETILQLRFILKEEHFKNGLLQIKCQSSIAPLYQDEIVHHIMRAEDSILDPIPEEVINEEVNKMFGQHTQREERDPIPIAESQNDRNSAATFRASYSSIVIILLLKAIS